MSCLAAFTLNARAADKPGSGPFDAKGREIFEKVIAMQTWLGNHQVPAMAEYLAGEFRAAGFPAEDVTVVPFNMPADKTATLVVRYRGDGTGGKPILLLAHMDVVTAKRSDWTRDPYTAHRRKRLLLRARHVRCETRHHASSPRLSCA